MPCVRLNASFDISGQVVNDALRIVSVPGFRKRIIHDAFLVVVCSRDTATYGLAATLLRMDHLKLERCQRWWRPGGRRVCCEERFPNRHRTRVYTGNVGARSVGSSRIWDDLSGVNFHDAGATTCDRDSWCRGAVRRAGAPRRLSSVLGIRPRHA